MSSIEEIAQGGALPNSEPEKVLAVESVRSRMRNEPAQSEPTTFATAEEQVKYDWEHLPSSQVRSKRNADPAYATALAKLLGEVAPTSATPIPEPAAEVVIETPVDPLAQTVLPSVAPTPAQVPVVVEEEADNSDPNLVKTAKGWEYRIDLGDGSGVQVFKGKTQKEVISQLGKAQVNASKKIADQNRKDKMKKALEQPDLVTTAVPKFEKKVLSADDQWRISQGLGDPSKAIKSVVEIIEAEFGMTAEEFREERRRRAESAAVEEARQIGARWATANQQFYNVPENRIKLQEFFAERSWPVTEKNLDIAYSFLDAAGELLQAPVEASREEVPAAAVVAPLIVEPPVTPAVSTPATPLVATPALKPNVPTPAQAGLPEGARVRPGSASTGMSPRQSSVRQGAAGPSPVGLTAEEYNRLPTSEVKRRYQTDKSFQAAVNKLIDEGKI
jgi:hypothetical protein